MRYYIVLENSGGGESGGVKIRHPPTTALEEEALLLALPLGEGEVLLPHPLMRLNKLMVNHSLHFSCPCWVVLPHLPHQHEVNHVPEQTTVARCSQVTSNKHLCDQSVTRTRGEEQQWPMHRGRCMVEGKAAAATAPAAAARPRTSARRANPPAVSRTLF